LKQHPVLLAKPEFPDPIAEEILFAISAERLKHFDRLSINSKRDKQEMKSSGLALQKKL
jgi:hypothetical protein